jgi:long-chain acyl-CoA synthetase
MVEDARQAWRPITWAEYAETVRGLSAALRINGLGAGDRVAILAPTSLEWEYVQLASLGVGANVIGVDPNYPDDQLTAVLADVAPNALFVWDEATLARVPEELDRGLKLLALLRDEGPRRSARGTPFESLCAGGQAARASAPGPGALADSPAITVFSSGTTRNPKPIVYTHAQIVLAVDAILDAFPDIAEDCVLVCWLPLANLFQRTVNFCAIAKGATSYIVSDPRKVMDAVPIANPHLIIGVPRFFERLHAAVQARLSSSRFAVAVADWAVGVGGRVAAAGRSGAAPRLAERLLLPIADRLVLRRVRAVFGSNLHYLVSGSAPMPLWLLNWFEAIRLPVFEAYGVSENIVPVAMNRPTLRRPGTVGKPLPPNEVKLAADGEILVRGPGVHRPITPATGSGSSGEANGGFWATGDYGVMDEAGFLRVTGRKSESFKDRGGRWIAPAEVEGRLRRIRYVEHAVLVQRDSGRLVAILNVDPSALLGREDRGGGNPSGSMPISLTPQIRERLSLDVEGALKDLPEYQKPSAVVVTAQTFSIGGGELTTNLKLRRNFVEARFQQAIRAAAQAAEARMGRRDARGERELVIVTA